MSHGSIGRITDVIVPPYIQPSAAIRLNMKMAAMLL